MTKRYYYCIVDIEFHGCMVYTNLSLLCQILIAFSIYFVFAPAIRFDKNYNTHFVWITLYSRQEPLQQVINKDTVSVAERPSGRYNRLLSTVQLLSAGRYAFCRRARSRAVTSLIWTPVVTKKPDLESTGEYSTRTIETDGDLFRDTFPSVIVFFSADRDQF